METPEARWRRLARSLLALVGLVAAAPEVPAQEPEKAAPASRPAPAADVLALLEDLQVLLAGSGRATGQQDLQARVDACLTRLEGHLGSLEEAARTVGPATPAVPLARALVHAAEVEALLGRREGTSALKRRMKAVRRRLRSLLTNTGSDPGDTPRDPFTPSSRMQAADHREGARRGPTIPAIRLEGYAEDAGGRAVAILRAGEQALFIRRGDLLSLDSTGATHAFEVVEVRTDRVVLAPGSGLPVIVVR